jgi:PiT family inorganic phosphate transporter
VVWAALFNFVAFFIFKDHGVADTIAKTVNKEFVTLPVIISGLVAAIVWNLLTWWFGIPSSSSHTLIGGFAGAAVAHAGLNAINPEPVIKTVSFIILAPLVGMIMAFIISLWFIHSFSKSIWPKLLSVGIIALMGWVLSVELNTKPAELSGMKFDAKKSEAGLFVAEVSHKSPAQHMGFKKEDQILSVDNHWSDVLLFGPNFKWLLLAVIVITIAVFTLFLSSLNVAKSQIWFKRMQLVSSAAFSIGHGGNDAQKVMGIITAALIAGGEIKEFTEMPVWVPLACYTAIAAGTMSGGWKIIKTMGSRITKVTPFEGVAAETAGAITLFLTENLKIPVSTTHTITGSIIGVGATKRLSAVRWGVTINLLWAWILTIPVSAAMAALVYGLFRLFL